MTVKRHRVDHQRAVERQWAWSGTVTRRATPLANVKAIRVLSRIASPNLPPEEG